MAKEQIIKIAKILNIALILIMLGMTILNVVVSSMWMEDGKVVDSNVVNNFFIVYVVVLALLSIIFLGSVYTYFKGKKFDVKGIIPLLFSAGLTLVAMTSGINSGILTWILSGFSIYKLRQMSQTSEVQ